MPASIGLKTAVLDFNGESISAAEMEVPCPTCGKVAARQISGGAGLQFVGHRGQLFVR